MNAASAETDTCKHQHEGMTNEKMASSPTSQSNSETQVLCENNQEDVDEAKKKSMAMQHATIIDAQSQSVSLQRCLQPGCCVNNMVHCPFCHVSQFKPTQPARVKDHLHKSHFQHAVYYDGLMIIKCFHDCRGSQKIKGGHYHCPVCSATLLKRNAFIYHLRAHAEWEQLDSSAVQAPDSKHPAFIYFQDHKIPLCREKCSDTLEAHYHCPLCQRTSPHLAALTAHLWRCKKKAVMVHKFVNDKETVSTAELFSPELVRSVCHPKDVMNLKWHLSVVRNLSDLPMTRCTQAECCKGRYHCPLCTTAKLKPNHLCHMRQHFVSHWRSGVPFGDYTVLVCYLPCEARHGTDKVRFHYHCPLCGGTRRRREAMTTHLVNCDPSQPLQHLKSIKTQDDDVDDGGGDDDTGEFSLSGGDISFTSAASISQQMTVTMTTTSLAQLKVADQAELQAAESLVDMDRILKQSAVLQPVSAYQIIFENCSAEAPAAASIERNQQQEEARRDLQQEQGCTSLTAINQSDTYLTPQGRHTQGEEDKAGACDNVDQNSGSGRDVASASGESEEKELEVFQQVTTQVAGSIVSELQQRGELNECLEAVGQVCNVSWTEAGDAVSMSCRLDDLCHAQNCLRKILKEGLQSFLKSPPAKPTSFESSATKSSSSPNSLTPQKAVRKRGRPRGSKNKWTMMLEDNEEYTPVIKQQRLMHVNEAALSQNSVSEKINAAEWTLCANNQLEKGDDAITGSGCYGRRTRGRKINYAQLNSGGVSPPYEAERSEGVVLPSPAKNPEPCVKRGRGRPRKVNAEVTVVVTPAMSSPKVALALEHSLTSDLNSDVEVRTGQKSLVGVNDLSMEGHACQKSVEGTSSAVFGSKRDGGLSVASETKTPNAPNKERENTVESSVTEVMSHGVSHSPQPAEVTLQKELLTSSDISSSLQHTASVSKAHFVQSMTNVVPMNGGNNASKVVIPPPQTVSRLTQTPVAAESGRKLSSTKIISNKTFGATQSSYYSSSAKASQRNSKRKYGGKDGKVDFAIIPTIVLDYSLNSGISGYAEDDESEASYSMSQESSVSLLSESLVVSCAKKPSASEGQGMHESQGAGSSVDNSHTTVSSLDENNGEGSDEIIRDTEQQNGISSIDHLVLAANSTENINPLVHAATGSVNSASCCQHKGETERQLENTKREECKHTDKNSTSAFTCPLCPVAAETYTAICDHITSSHPKSPKLTCDVCQISCPTYGALMLHVERRHGPQLPSSMHVCSICRKAYPSARALQWHRSFIHKQSTARRKPTHSLQCTFCSYQATDPWDMRHHREHHRDHPAACPVCNKVLSTENAVKVHVAAVHSNSSFSCPICSKTFAHMRYLRSHMRRHGAEKRHKCGICGWRFHETNTLRAHMDTHKPRSQRTYTFKCPYCPAAYNSKANYRDHMNKHTGERPHVCPKCGRGFAFRSMLATHVAFVHSDERPHACTVCPKTFKTRQQLRQHSLFHSGDSPHVCAKCGRTTVSSSRLKAHIKRCKGRNMTGRQIVIQQTGGVSVVSAGHNTKLQTIQLLTSDTVNVGGSLVSLLGGQQVRVLQDVPGKQAVLTILPFQSVVSQDGGQINEQNQIATTFQGSAVLEQSSSDLKLGASSSGIQIEGGHTAEESAFLAETGTAGVNVSGPSGIRLEMSEANSQIQPTSQTISSVQGIQSNYIISTMCTVQNGQSSNQALQVTSSMNSHIFRIVDSISSSQDLSTSINPQVHAATSTVSSTSGCMHQGVKGDVSQVTKNPTSVSLPYSCTDSSLVNISLADGSGGTHTILLPPDLIKQEVLIIENEDGQQSLINLANVQVIQSDRHGLLTDSGAHEPHSDSDIYAPHSESTTGEGYQTLHATSNTSDSHSLDSVAQTAQAEYAMTDQSKSFEPDMSHITSNEDEVDNKMAIFVCSTCDQAFSSLSQAEQHILSEHCEIGSSAEQTGMNDSLAAQNVDINISDQNDLL